MLIGQSLVCEFDGDETVIDTVTYSPWFERQGDGATFFVQVLALKSGNVTLDVVIQHKNRDDVDSAATTAGSFTTLTTITEGKKDVSGLKELLRLQYTVSSSSNTSEWVHFRVMPPAWEFNGA